MPILSQPMKLTINSLLWEGQRVSFDENEKGFTLATTGGVVKDDQFADLLLMGADYDIDKVIVSESQTQVHFQLADL